MTGQQRSSRGFTVIELLVVLGILTFLGGASIKLYMSTMSIERQGRTVVKRHQEVRQLLDSLERDLAALPPSLPGGGSGFRGDLETATTEGEAPSPRLMYDTYATTDPAEFASRDYEPFRKFRKINLGFEGIKERHLTFTQVVLGASREGASSAQAPGASAAAPVTFTEISRLTVKYFDGSHWQDRWTSEVRPRALKVTVEAGFPRDRVPPETFTRLIMVPREARP